MKSYRPDKVASVIREIVGAMIAEKLQDPRISRFTSVTRVEVSGDLQNAKVYVSIMGSEVDERNTLRGLDHARGLIQRAVARGVSTRVCPQVRFVVDGSIKKAQEILRIIDANAADRGESEDFDAGPAAPAEPEPDDDDLRPSDGVAG